MRIVATEGRDFVRGRLPWRVEIAAEGRHTFSVH